MAYAFYIKNEGSMPFAELVTYGHKIWETRSRRTLDKLVNTPDPVYIIRTGRGKNEPSMIIGRCYIRRPEFIQADRFKDPDVIAKTYVFPDSSFYPVDVPGKWCYPIKQAEPLRVSVPVPDNAIKHGRTWIEFDENGVIIA